MTVVRKSITFTKQQNEYVKSLIERGLYVNDSEYVRDIIRKDQERRRAMLELENALLEGMASGVSNETIDDIQERVLKAHREKA